MEAVLRLKEKYGFILLEDACAAIGARYRGTKVGLFGDMGSFSFYFGHQMSTIEGGMVSTSQKVFSDLLRMIRSHGWSQDLDRETHNKLAESHGVDDFHTPFVFYEPGFNLRSTDLNAFIGLGQLKKLDWMIRRRTENHQRYIGCLGDTFTIQKCEADCQIASISFGMLANSTEERKKIVKSLVANGIETRIFSAGNLGLHPFWFSRYGKASFPMADKIHYRGLFLPNHPSLSIEDIEFIAKVVMEA